MQKTIISVAFLLAISFSNCSNDESKDVIKKGEITKKKENPIKDTPIKDDCEETLYATSSTGNNIYKDCKGRIYLYTSTKEKLNVAKWECGTHREKTLWREAKGGCYYLNKDFQKVKVGATRCDECIKK